MTEVATLRPQALDLQETFGEHTPHEVAMNMAEKPERWALPNGRYLAKIDSYYLINSERTIFTGAKPLPTGIFYQGVTIGYKVLVTKEHIAAWEGMDLVDRQHEWLLESVKKSGWYAMREFDLEFAIRPEVKADNGQTYKAPLFTRRLLAGLSILGQGYEGQEHTGYEVLEGDKPLVDVPVVKYVRETVAQQEAFMSQLGIDDRNELPEDKRWRKVQKDGVDVMTELKKGPVGDIVIGDTPTIGLFVYIDVEQSNPAVGKWNKFRAGSVTPASQGDYMMLHAMGVELPQVVVTQMGIADAKIQQPYALPAMQEPEVQKLPEGQSIKPPADYEPTTDEERKAFGKETKEAFAEYLIDGKAPDLVGLCKTLFNKAPKQISKDELKQFREYMSLLLTFMEQSVTHDTFVNKSELVKAILIPTDGLTDSDPEAMDETFIYTTGLSHAELSLAGTCIVNINSGDMSWDDFQGGF